MLDMVRSDDTIEGILSVRYSLTTPYGKFSAVPIVRTVADTFEGLTVMFEIKRINVFLTKETK